MKIFISWSGETSRSIAQALRDWLPRIIQSVDPWTSDQDIQSGARWGAEIARRLTETNFGIVCVTPDNHDRPWLMFEAGALSKAVDEARVCPYLFGLSSSQLQGPLVQFQAKAADKDGTRRLVLDINRAIERPINENLLLESFDLWWPRLEALLQQIPVPASAERPAPDQQGGEPNVMGLLLSFMVPANELQQLENLAKPGAFIYTKHENFVKELRRLRDLGFIEMLPGKTIGGMPPQGDAKEHVQLTDQGRTYLHLRNLVVSTPPMTGRTTPVDTSPG
ncbi:MAG TPA: TIR domain-containing protein [Chloroflexota bacterium]|nr:TIR domain-containing protein [Chloroflexota bacterium]